MKKILFFLVTFAFMFVAVHCDNNPKRIVVSKSDFELKSVIVKNAYAFDDGNKMTVVLESGEVFTVAWCKNKIIYTGKRVDIFYSTNPGLGENSFVLDSIKLCN
jgi:hypothetical protein